MKILKSILCLLAVTSFALAQTPSPTPIAAVVQTPPTISSIHLSNIPAEDILPIWNGIIQNPKFSFPSDISDKTIRSFTITLAGTGTNAKFILNASVSGTSK